MKQNLSSTLNNIPSFMYNARQPLIEVWLLNTDLDPGIEYNCSDLFVHFFSQEAKILGMKPQEEKHDRT